MNVLDAGIMLGFVLLFVAGMLGLAFGISWLVDSDRKPKIKKIKGVKPDPAMTEKIRNGQVPYGYKPAQPKNDGKVPQVRYVPCTFCSGMAIVKGRLEAKNNWRGLACFCEKCKKWSEGELSRQDQEEDSIAWSKRQGAITCEQEKARKRNRRNATGGHRQLPF